MGVNGLWSILEPVRESVPLYHLTGKTLAVDLSLWVCEAQSVKEMVGRVTKPHLRNLFFRVSSLTQMGIKPIFVMEGQAPKLKSETMSKRNQMRFGPSKKAAPPTAKKTGRSQFNAVLKECAAMLDCLGVPWVTAAGEAEAMCAYLDALGLVDGCITNDGDAFLYGAQTVYRNFKMNTKDPQVECYKMAKIRSELRLERETLVGLAILLGCDYLPKGVPGVGKEQTLKLIKSLKAQTLLQKFTDWQREGLEAQDQAVKKPAHCLVCRHPGSLKAHERRGCALCGSQHFCQPQDYDYSCPCAWHQAELARQDDCTQASIKRKTLASEGFPFTEIINEFLVTKDRPIQNITRRKPSMLLMQNFASDKMEWPKSYTSEKVLVLMTYTEMMNRKYGRENTSQIQPMRVVKSRVRSGVACFEIIWKKPDHYVYPEDQPEECRDTVSTVEEQALFRAAYPDVVESFLKEMEEAKENKLKQKKQKKRKDKELGTRLDEISDLLSQVTLHSSSGDREGPFGTDADRAVPAAPERNPPAPERNPMAPERNPTAPERNPPAPKRTPPAPERNPQAPERNPPAPERNPPAPERNPPAPAMLAQAQSSTLGHYEEKAVLCCSPVSCLKAPATASAPSPSVSTVIEELHLSDIDWDAASFSCTQSPGSLNTEHAQNGSPAPEECPRSVARTASETGGSTAVQPSALNTAGLSEPNTSAKRSHSSLRERVLARITSVSNSSHADAVITHTNKSHCGGHTQGMSVGMELPNTSSNAMLTGKEQHIIKTLLNDGNKVSSLKISQHPMSESLKREKGCMSMEPMAQHRLVKRGSVHTGQTRWKSSDQADQVNFGRRKAQSVKKSVCSSVCSSSENSDVENRPVAEQRKTVRSKARKQCLYLTDYSLKPNKSMGIPASTRAVSESLHGGPQALRSEQGQRAVSESLHGGPQALRSEQSQRAVSESLHGGPQALRSEQGQRAVSESLHGGPQTLHSEQGQRAVSESLHGGPQALRSEQGQRAVSESLHGGPQALRSEQGQRAVSESLHGGPQSHTDWELTDDGEVFIQSPVSAQQMHTTQGNDTVLSVDSPLPLMERLKLKFK